MSDQHAILDYIRFGERVDLEGRLNVVIDQVNRLTRAHIGKEHNASYVYKLLMVVEAARYKRLLERQEEQNIHVLAQVDFELDRALLDLDLFEKER